MTLTTDKNRALLPKPPAQHPQPGLHRAPAPGAPRTPALQPKHFLLPGGAARARCGSERAPPTAPGRGALGGVRPLCPFPGPGSQPVPGSSRDKSQRMGGRQRTEPTRVERNLQARRSRAEVRRDFPSLGQVRILETRILTLRVCLHGGCLQAG